MNTGKQIGEQMRRATTILFVLLVAIGYGANLAPCPDCDQAVSPRAIMCPHCGCPGDVIAEYVAAKEAEDAPPPLYPVVELNTDSATGWAVGYADSGESFLVMDAGLLSAATSLDMSPITTNTAVSYRRMQISTESPLVRFRTDSTNISYLGVARSSSSPGEKMLYLHTDGHTTPAAPASSPNVGVVCVTDSSTDLVGIVRHVDAESSVILLPESREEWKDITPGDFRSQTRLLTEAANAVAEGNTAQDILEQLGETDWATTYFKTEANRIIEQSQHGGTP